MKKLLLAVLLGNLFSGSASAYTMIEGGMRIFLTKDPAGFVDGPNLYTYCKQNPWTNFDPEGLRAETGDEKKAIKKMDDLANASSKEAHDLRSEAAHLPKEKAKDKE
jgi:uncharacterized protein RhaS with RHS repeats